jgi:mannose-1-phosphate guanylyltransferase
LGAKPNYPETDYGWIELGPQLGQEGSELFRVRRFQEKPSIDVAQKLLERDSVWNTFVMIGHVQAFLRMVRATLPDLCRALAPMRLWAGRETHIERSLYERVPSVSFSDGVLAADTGQLVVLRLNEVGWSDLGDPGRAFLAAREIGCALEWTEHLGLGGLAKGPAAETSGKAAAVAIA